MPKEPLDMYEKPLSREDIALGDDDDWGDYEDDTTEPSEKHKREVMKIHRNLGHPNNKELARALKHAGAKKIYYPLGA